MELRHIALGNLRRRKGKAILIVIGLSVAVAAFVLVLSLVFSMQRTMDQELTRYGSNLVVASKSPELSLSYGGFALGGTGTGRDRFLDETAVSAIRSLPEAAQMAAVIPVRLAPVDVGPAESASAGTGPGGSTRPLLAVGTDLALGVSVKPWWRVEGSMPDAGEVLVGLNVRNELGVEVGDVLSVEGSRLEIAGVLWETGGEEDNLLFMERSLLDTLVGEPGRIDLIEISSVGTEVVDTLRLRIAEAVPDAEVTAVRESIEFTNQANGALAAFGLAVGGLVALISAFVVMATMLTAVKERRKEIGVLRAVGYRQRHVAVLILLEAIVLSSFAAFTGVAAGLLGAAFAPKLVPELTLSLELHPVVLVVGVTVAFVIGLGAAVYPARRAANLDPATALRNV